MSTEKQACIQLQCRLCAAAQRKNKKTSAGNNINDTPRNNDNLFDRFPGNGFLDIRLIHGDFTDVILGIPGGHGNFTFHFPPHQNGQLH